MMTSVAFQDSGNAGRRGPETRQFLWLSIALLLSFAIHAMAAFLVPESDDEGVAQFGVGGTLVSLGPAGREAGGEVAKAAGEAAPAAEVEAAEVEAAEAESLEAVEALQEPDVVEPETSPLAEEPDLTEPASVSALQVVAEPAPLEAEAQVAALSVSPVEAPASSNSVPLLALAPSEASDALLAEVRPLEATESLEAEELVEPVTEPVAEPVTVLRPAPPPPKRRPKLIAEQKQSKPAPPASREPQSVEKTAAKPPSPQADSVEKAAVEELAKTGQDGSEENQTEQEIAGEGGRSGRAGASEAGEGNNSTGGGAPGAQSDYYQQIQAWLEKHKRYPRRSKLRNEQGVVMLRFVVARDGSVSVFDIEESSGYKRLDKEALGMIERAQPLPAMPPDMVGTELSLVVPVNFELR